MFFFHAYRPHRKGNYTYVSMEEALEEGERQEFLASEHYDLSLYSFAASVFMNRLDASGCPIVD